MRVAPLAAVVLLPLALAGAPTFAQSAAEISFWESVRDSKNPVELQAYINQYPNGAFVVLAKARLAALGAKPASIASTAPAPAAAAPHTPQVGDTWVYRLSYPRVRGQWGQPTRPPSTLSVSVTEAQAGRIVDQFSVDGGTPVSRTHAGRELIAQGAVIFSPYLVALDTLGPDRRGAVTNGDGACARAYLCEAKSRFAGTERVEVPAGRYLATKVIVDQEWRGAQAGFSRLAGSRTLTIWYAPETGRAIKYSSRLRIGEAPPMDANFDVELVSYQLK